MLFFFFSSRRRHTRSKRDWSSDVCSSDLGLLEGREGRRTRQRTQYQGNSCSPNRQLRCFRLATLSIRRDDHNLWGQQSIRSGSAGGIRRKGKRSELSRRHLRCYEPVLVRAPDEEVLTRFPAKPSESRVNVGGITPSRVRSGFL